MSKRNLKKRAKRLLCRLRRSALCDQVVRQPDACGKIDQIYSAITSYAEAYPAIEIRKQVREKAKMAIYDFLACAAAGAVTQEGQWILRMHSQQFNSPTRNSDSPDRYQWMQSAAFTLSTLSQIHDYNDGNPKARTEGGAFHPGRVLIPTALISAFIEKSTGKSFLENIILGYDCAMGIKNGPRQSPSDAMAGAVVAGAFSNLDGKLFELMVKLTGFIAPPSGGEDFEVNHLTCGHQTSAVFKALEMVSNGCQPVELAAHNHGNFRFTPPVRPGLQLDHLYLKPYPCCRSIHLFVDMAIDLAKTHSLTRDKIDKIQVTIPLNHSGPTLSVPSSATAKSLQFNFPYCIGTALCEKALDIHHFDTARQGYHEALELASRVDCKFVDTSTGEIQVITVGGMRIMETSESRHVKGSFENPMTWDDLVRKMSNAGLMSSPCSLDISKQVSELDQMMNVAPWIGDIFSKLRISM